MNNNNNNDVGGGVVPAWIEGLMSETYFVRCQVHHSFRKNEKNIFCLHCCQTFCPHCLPSHHPQHPLLQVRRYVYQDVIRLDDLERVVDCSYIQPYTINGAKVIFLNERTTQSTRSHCKLGSTSSSNSDIIVDNVCLTCHRILQQPFNFCSFSCKVNHYIHQGDDLSSILYELEELDLGFVGLSVDGPDQQLVEDEEDGESPRNHPHEPTTASSSSNSSSSKKKGRGSRKFLQNMTIISMGNRRKGAPHRSPLT